MPIHYAIDPGHDVVLVEMVGAVGPGEVLAFLERLALEPALRPGMPQLVDCGRMKTPPTVAASESVAEGFARLKPRFGGARCAVVVADALMYGAMRQFSALAMQAAVEVRPFLGVAAARAWLAIPDAGTEDGTST